MTELEELAALKTKLADVRQTLDQMAKSEEASAKRDALEAVCGAPAHRAANETSAKIHLLQSELYEEVRKMIP